MKKHLAIRLLSLMLALMLAAAAAACGTASDGETDTTAPAAVSTAAPDVQTEPPSAEDAAWDALPELACKDYELRVLVRNSDRWMSDFGWDTETTGDLMMDAVVKRDLNVSEKLGMTFTFFKSSDSNYETDALNTILSGTDSYDVIAAHTRAAFKYATSGCAMDWNGVEGLDLNAAWWDQDARESFALNGKLYTMVGALSHNSLGCAVGMLFNKAILDDRKLDYPYDSVKDGSWTFEKFSSMALELTDDLNGDGAIKPADDAYGYVTYQWIGPMQMLYSGGGRVIDREDGELVIALDTERNLDVYTDFFALTDQKNCYIEANRDEKKSIYNCRDIFVQGRAMFTDLNLDETRYLSEMTQPYGIIPFPKYAADVEKYYTYVDGATNFFVIPTTNPDSGKTGLALEALSIEGLRSVYPSYYEVTLKTRRSTDAVSAEMIDFISDGRVYDIGVYCTEMAGSSLASTGYNLVNLSGHNFKIFCTANVKVAQKTLEKFLKTIEALG